MTYAHTLNEILSICNEHELYVSSKYIATHSNHKPMNISFRYCSLVLISISISTKNINILLKLRELISQSYLKVILLFRTNKLLFKMLL